MRKLTITELRYIQLEILDDVHHFCKENGIIYSLTGGTMLGAVRHKGFIPWDDDIDIMMPRTDYERFKKLYKSEKNQIIDLSKIDSCSEQFIKVSRIGTVMEDVLLHRHLWGVNIDVFPADGMPEDYITYTNHLIEIHNAILDGFPYYKSARRHKLFWHLRYLTKVLLRHIDTDVLSMKQRLDDIAMQHLPENSPLATVIYGDFRILPFPSSYFYQLEEREFEGKLYSCITHTDEYLTALYGDYMTLPPKEKQVTHHLYDSFSF